MTLPWVRLDGTLFSHDKTLYLVSRRHGLEAVAVYCMALTWAGANHTDGRIPRAALPMLHGKPRHAELLVEANMWEPADGGWQIRNWALRQETADITQARSVAKKRAACARWHPRGCGCWQPDGTVIPMPRRATPDP